MNIKRSGSFKMPTSAARTKMPIQKWSTWRRVRRGPILSASQPHGEAARNRKGDREKHDEFCAPFAGAFGEARRTGDIDRVKDHDVDDGVDGVGIKHAANEEAKKPGKFLAVAQRVVSAAQRIDIAAKLIGRIWIATFLDEEQARDREEQKRNRVECEQQAACCPS